MRQPPLTPLATAALHAGSPERILVIGCGEGDAVLFLAREFPTARVRGVDPSEVTIRRATARVGLDPEGRVAFKVGKPGSLPYPDAFFDLVAAVASRPKVDEVLRVLAPGGRLILAGSRGREWGRPIEARLQRRGVEWLRSGSAGEGEFHVGRLRDAGK